MKKNKLMLVLGNSLAIGASVAPVALTVSCGNDSKKQEEIDNLKKQLKEAEAKAKNAESNKALLNKRVELLKFKIEKLELLANVTTPATIEKVKEKIKALDFTDENTIEELDAKMNNFKLDQGLINDIRKDTDIYAKEIQEKWNIFSKARKGVLSKFETGGILTDDSKKALLDFEKEELKKFEDYRKGELSTTEKVWVDEMITLIKTDIKIVESDARYVGHNATNISDDNMLKFFWNVTYYDVAFLAEKELNQLIENLKQGAAKGITNSKLYVKRGIAAILQKDKDYKRGLSQFIEGTDESLTLSQFIDKYGKTSGGKTKDLLNKFVKFYGVEYFNKAHGEIPEIKLSKVNFSADSKASEFEAEDHISVFAGSAWQTVYGLGYTNADLSAKKVGIGGMENKEAAKKIYDAQLFAQLTVEKPAQEIYDWGVRNSKNNLEGMKFVANKLATIITGSADADWTPEFKFNDVKLEANASNIAKSVKITANIRKGGQIDMQEWYKFIMSDQFYYGLEEKTLSEDSVNKLLTEDKYKGFREKANKAGFEKYIKEDQFVKAPAGTEANLIDSEGWLLDKPTDQGGKKVKLSDMPYEFNSSITNKQMYAAGIEALRQYNNWKEKTEGYASSFFNDGIPSCNITPVAENSDDLGSYSSSKGEFYFNLKPYMGLPKWSTTSFTNHESKMGHHNQLWYTKSYKATEGGMAIEGLFDSTAYAEGWALFVEWFAMETGWYGTPAYDNDNWDAIPTDFTKALNGYLPPLAGEVATPAELEYIKNVAGGTYWDLAGSVQTTLQPTEQAIKAIEIGNLLQYYGMLNEAMMRDNRLALDTAIHGVIDKTDNYIGSGISIKEQREFMEKHMQLPSDIYAYPKRYLGYPAQATSYNSGKEVMKEIYKKVQAKSGKTRKEFIEDKDGIKKLFNLYLQFGNIPMEALENLIFSEYGIEK
ncbi:DUF885 family protein [Mycoplasma sp. Mirounga ES2805-ORL]|uniref:DUF885 family protein n=1 Tax=Mycoplasma sp. Mirounga ES2805-ORL TaxID=754514 RepID=UPI00197C496C|nr:DUF885 family protein [Mycoplasma sp. Mirounga ES2805-ORL]QSF13590.1 DUF885 family protein [Mycoplasma sp. Mirounga ES2805-ORL]